MISEGVTTLKNVLDEVHRVPKYQRNYSWGEKQAEELWIDLNEFCKNRTVQSSYIFGQIVVYRSSSENNATYIIDGQQRLTTSYIYLAAVNKLIHEMYPDKNEMPDSVMNYMNYIRGRLFNMESPTSLSSNLITRTEHRDFFKSILNGDPHAYDESDTSKKNMFIVYNKFLRLIYKYLTNEKINDKDPLDYSEIRGNAEYFEILVAINKCFMDFKMVYLVSNSLKDAYRIFDTVNTRGLKLTMTDLVKNYIFSTSYTNDGELNDDDLSLEENWNNASEQMGKSFEKMFRYLMIAKYGLVREGELLTTVKNNFTDVGDVKQLILELNLVVKIYLAIEGRANIFDEETNRILRGIHDVKKDYLLFCPLIIAVYLRNNRVKADPNENINRLVKAIDVVTLREVFIAESGTNSLEGPFSELARNYYIEDSTIEELIGKLYELCCNDETFKTRIIVKDNWTNAAARYVLSEIHNRDVGTAVVKGKNDVEHIMPKNNYNRDSWGTEDSETKLNNIWRLGNLLILEMGLNRSLQDSSFTIKVAEYRKIDARGQLLDSDRSFVLNSETWTIREIIERTNSLADSVIKHWPRR